MSDRSRIVDGDTMRPEDSDADGESSLDPSPNVRRERDDFPARVRRLLAGQAGHLCANPACQRPTTGPSRDAGRVVDLGVAAHITAASVLGPRFDSSLTSEQRKHENNGIWLCQDCGKLVDSDNSTHSVELLQEWKERAIARAERALAKGDVDPDGVRRLAREERYHTAKLALTAALQARALILRGVEVARHVRNIRRVRQSERAGLLSEAAKWYADTAASIEATEVAIRSVRVLWPEEPQVGLVGLHVRLATWRNWFSENVAIVTGAKGAHARQSNESWSWDDVFNGDESSVERMNGQVTEDLDNVEAWARPYIHGSP